jgi:hypothetical protein
MGWRRMAQRCHKECNAYVHVHSIQKNVNYGVTPEQRHRHAVLSKLVGNVILHYAHLPRTFIATSGDARYYCFTLSLRYVNVQAKPDISAMS